MVASEKKEDRAAHALILIFLVLAAGIVLAGYLSYAAYAKRYRSEVGRQLFAVADLKAAELYDWRMERLGDANVLFRNDVFSRLVSRYLESPGDAEVNRDIRSWLGKFQAYHQYDRIMLLDTRYVKRLVIPDKPERDNSFVSPSSSRILKSGKLAFEDFYWNEHDQRYYLKILVPIFEENGSRRMIAVLAFRIDPNTYLYPYIKNWPTVSETAETLLVRREGNEVVFLNETRSQKKTALKLRLPLERMNLPVVKAVLGREGIVEGLNDRDEPVIAALRTVPDSPWCLSVQMDISEINALLRERGTLMIALVAALLIGVGASVGLVWRQQRLRFYREREDAAEALQASEEIYRRLVETANEAIYVAQDGMLKFVNRMTVEITGYSEQELTSTPFSKIIHPEDRDVSVGRHLRRIKGEAVPDRNQCRIITRDGNIKWAEISGVMIEWEGKPATLNVLTDITERKRAEEQRIASEARYKELFDSSGTSIVIIDEHGKYLMVNDKAAKEYGTSREEVIGKSIFDFLPEPAARKYLEENKRLIETGGRREYEDSFMLPGGKKTFLIVDQCLKDDTGRYFAIQSSAIDITERKQAAEALRQSEENFRRSLDESPLGVRIVTLDGETLYVNQALLDIYGYDSIDELQNTPVAKRYTPESYIEFKERREKRRNGFDDPSEYGISIIRRDGSIRHLQAHRKEILWDDKRQYQALYLDITESRRAEEALRERDIQFKKLAVWVPGMIYQFLRKPDGSYCVPFTSEGIRDIFGCSPQDVREDISPISSVIWPEDFDKFISSIEDSARHLTVWTCEYRVQVPGGPVRWILGNSTPEKLADGSILWHGFNMDITERKQVEAALRESEERLQLIFENAPIGITHFDDTGTVTACNRRLADILGAPQEEVVGVNMLREFKDIKQKSALETALSGRDGYFEGEYLSVTGAKRAVIRTIYTPLFAMDGSVAGGISITEDVTDRRHAEEALRESEGRYRMLIETTRDLIYTTDRRGRITYINPALERILGYSPHELNGKSFAEILAPEFVDKARKIFRRAMKMENIPIYEADMVRKDGTRLSLEFNVETLYDEKGKPAGRYGIGRDITDRKRAEEALKRSEEKYRDIFETIAEGIFRTTPEGYFIIMNPAFAAICGYASPEEMMKEVTDIPNQLYVNPEDRLRFQKRISAEGKVRGFEVQFKHPTGRPVWVSIHSKVVYDKQGNISFYEGTIEDINERKQAEVESMRSYQQLRALAERLQQIREESQIAIAREIHDELGGGLTGVKMALSLLSQKIEEKEEVNAPVSLMKRINAASQLIDDLIRNVRRIGTKLRPSVLDDLGLVAALEWECTEFSGRTGIPCEFVPAFDYIELEEATTTAVFRIFQEALTNVSRHSGADEVTVLFREDEGKLCLEVMDNGRGITDAETLGMKSLGILGMRERALVFGGEIVISGKPGMGTTVILKIPQK